VLVTITKTIGGQDALSRRRRRRRRRRSSMSVF
jgi:hypothetical protein